LGFVRDVVRYLGNTNIYAGPVLVMVAARQPRTLVAMAVQFRDQPIHRLRVEEDRGSRELPAEDLNRPNGFARQTYLLAYPLACTERDRIRYIRNKTAADVTGGFDGVAESFMHGFVLTYLNLQHPTSHPNAHDSVQRDTATKPFSLVLLLR